MTEHEANRPSSISREAFKAMWTREVPKVVARHQIELAQVRASIHEIMGFPAPKPFVHEASQLTALVERMRRLERDHEPDGWPCVQMEDVSSLCEWLERYDVVVRDLASYLGCGDYDSPGLMDPEDARAKIRFGIDLLLKSLPQDPKP
jgi:hypothetical protein